MFLKLSYKNKEKDIPLQRETQNLDSLKKQIEEFTEKKENSLLISFIDLDEEVVQVKDEFDLEYMLEQVEPSLVVKIEDKDDNVTAAPAEKEAETHQTLADLTEQLKEETQQSAAQQIPEPIPQSADVQIKEQAPKLETKHSDDGRVVVKMALPVDAEFQPVCDNECSLDITMINKVFDPKSEHIDNRYDFTKHRESHEDRKNVKEECNAVSRSDLQNALDKHTFDELLKTNPTVVDLGTKIEELGKLIETSFASIKKDIANQSQASISVKSAEKPQRASLVKTVHKGVRCDNCNKNPLEGRRFKCLQCSDYDLCEACEALNEHRHPMIRFSEPTNRDFAEQITQLYVIKSRLAKESEDEIKIRVLKNLAGDKYPQTFYTEFIAKRKKQSLEDFIDDVVKIFG